MAFYCTVKKKQFVQQNVLLDFNQVKKKKKNCCWNCNLLFEFQQIIELLKSMYFSVEKNVISNVNRSYYSNCFGLPQ